MIGRRPVNLSLISLFLCLLLITIGRVQVFAQITITPNAQPIKITLDPTGHYTLKLSDVAKVTGTNIAKIALNPSTFDNASLGNQTVTVTAYANFDPLKASFSAPGAMAIDNKGNIYVIDQGTNKIRKITPAGQVLTIAGNGKQGYVDDVGSKAEFDGPTGIAVDGSGNEFITDVGDLHVRKIDTSYNVITIAGLGNPGELDGPAYTATFTNPVAICLDKSDNIYIGEAGSDKIRKLSNDGNVSTVGTAIPAIANTNPLSLSSIAVDNSGNIFAQLPNYITEVHPDGSAIYFAGNPAGGVDVDGTGTSAQFNNACYFTSDASGNLYVVEQNETIRKVTPNGTVTTVLKGLLNPPRCQNMVVDASGNFYIADAVNNYIEKIAPNGAKSIFAGNGSAASVDNTQATTLSNIPVIVVPADPNAPIATIAARTQPLCFGKADTFTLDVTNTTAYTEQWMVNGIPVPGKQTPIFATNVLYDGDKINCVVTPLAPGSILITSNTITLHVIPQVIPSISIEPIGVSACQGTSFTFTATTVNAGINPTIQWYLNGQPVNNPGLTYTSTSFQTGDQLQCTLINNSDCTYSNMANSNIPTIQVNANTAITISIAPEDAGPYCPNEQVSFIATTNAPSGSASYQWYVNGQPAGTDNTVYTHNFNDGDVITCQLTAVRATGCFTFSGSTETSSPYTIKIGQQSAATISIAQTTTRVCAGTPVTFTASAGNGGSSPQYQWQVNGVNAGDDQNTFTSDSLQNGDKITCILTGSAGACSAPVTSNTVMATIGALPVVAFAGNIVYINSGTGLKLAPQITGDIATYSWTPVTGLNDPTIQNPLASPIATTQYTLLVTTNDGCQASGTVTVDVFYQVVIPNTFTPNGDGINDLWDIKGLEFFPGATVDVYNRYGSLVYHSNGYAIPWDGKFGGKLLPVSTYYYIIDPKNGKPKLSGSLTIIK